MKSYKTDGKYILKIEKGELVHASINECCNAHDIKNATVTGIGAVEFVRCGYYDLPNKNYLFKEYEEIVEVISYLGNVIVKEGGLFVHAHATFSDRENKVFGGHVDEMRVGVVFEVVLNPLSSTIERKLDKEIGLYLMDI